MGQFYQFICNIGMVSALIENRKLFLMKTYRLLRNNKESGPYEADQIIAMGLKAYDLIWAEGKSAAWRYPGELEEFKSYAPLVEEQPYDRFYKRKDEQAKVIVHPTLKKDAVQTNSPAAYIKATANQSSISKPEKIAAQPSVKMESENIITPASTLKVVAPKTVISKPENIAEQPTLKKEEMVMPVVSVETVAPPSTNTFFSKPSNTDPEIKGIMVVVGEKKATPATGLFEIRGKVINEPVVHYEELPLLTEKPRIRIKAASRQIEPVQPIMVQQVSSTTEETAIPVVASKPTNWEHAWLDWEQEKKAAAYAEKRTPEIKPNAATEALELKIKFSRSLEEIKEQYAATVLKPKVATKNFIPAKPQQWLGLIGVMAILLVLGFWMGGLNNQTASSLSNPPAPQIASREILPTPSENQIPETSISNSNQNTTNDQNAQTLVYTIPKRNSSTTEKLQSKQKKTTDNFKYTPVVQEKQEAIPAQKSVSADKDGRSASYRKTETASNTAPVTTIEDSKPVNNLSRAKTVNDFIQLGSGSIALNEGASNNQLQVKNTSDINFNLIVIDLQYFDANGKYRKGETVYLKNFNGGQSIHVKIPEDKSSSKVTAAVSMISSDEKNIYLIAE